MQKTYWWRIAALFLSSGIVFSGWIYETFYCFTNGKDCFLDQLRLTILEPTIILSLSLLAVSPFLFFIRDEIFIKWLRFALVWFVVTAIFVLLAPVSTGGFMSFGPEKESVSIWMGSIFVIISLAYIAREKWKTR